MMALAPDRPETESALLLLGDVRPVPGNERFYRPVDPEAEEGAAPGNGE